MNGQAGLVISWKNLLGFVELFEDRFVLPQVNGPGIPWRETTDLADLSGKRVD
ncbi:MAG: hypothetical protein O9254_00575 [Rhodobacteraceae bacterium]|nr:hypothetical protein [Paracoccaceae bacterium]